MSSRHWYPHAAYSGQRRWRATRLLPSSAGSYSNLPWDCSEPRLIRELRLFAVADHAGNADLVVDSIHNDEVYRRVRQFLAQQHARENQVPRHPGRLVTSATATVRSSDEKKAANQAEMLEERVLDHEALR
ncbi:MAG: SpoVR family protein [Devosia sp.]|nr:SpoVR family protein [Devosia sp.]